MKNFFLIATILFTLGSFSDINANNEHETLIPKVPKSCFEKAWDYGTWMGAGEPDMEYYFTNWYYTTWCE